MKYANNLFLLLFLLFMETAQAQTIHSYIFADRALTPIATVQNKDIDYMKKFCEVLTKVLHYNLELNVHDNSENFSSGIEKDLKNLRAADGDIVIFYYSGYGIGLSDIDDNWPSMYLNGGFFPETSLFKRLCKNAIGAKLVLCLYNSSNTSKHSKANLTFNKDSLAKDVAMSLERTSLPDMVTEIQDAKIEEDNTENLKKLFTDFEGSKAIIASSCARGQYSIGSSDGSYFCLSLLGSIYNLLNNKDSYDANWKNIFEITRARCLELSESKQQPIYKIYDNFEKKATAKLIEQIK